MNLIFKQEDLSHNLHQYSWKGVRKRLIDCVDNITSYPCPVNGHFMTSMKKRHS